MSGQIVKVSGRGGIILPAKIRKSMKIKSGSTVIVKEEGDLIILQPVSSFTDALSGLTEVSFGKNAAEIQSYINENVFTLPLSHSPLSPSPTVFGVASCELKTETRNPQHRNLTPSLSYPCSEPAAS